MKRLEIVVDGKLYVWKPKLKNIIAIGLTLGLVMFGVTNVGFGLVKAGTYHAVDSSQEVNTKDLDVLGLNHMGRVSVGSINIPEYNGSMAVTEYGELPILAVNTSLIDVGEIAYIEMGDTDDTDKSTVYWCIDGSKYLPYDSVALVNNNLTGNNYSSIPLYEVVAE